MAPPYKTMLLSTAYERMLAEHPAEFAPATVSFSHDPRSAIDRRNSFRVKAALVYEAVTGHHVDDHHMSVANRLLIALARACHSALPPSSSDKKDSAGNGEDAKKQQEIEDAKAEEKDAELIDEAWDDERKQVVDAIFLVVGFLPRLKEAIAKSADRDGVDESFKSGHMQDIVTDVVKLENQLPLQILLDVAGVAERAVNDTVAREEFAKDVPVAGGEYKLGFSKETFGDVVQGFCWYYSPFVSKKPADLAPKDAKAKGGVAAAATDGAKAVAATDDSEAAAPPLTLLNCLHESAVPLASQGAARAGGRPSRMPAAKELRRSGVRIQAAESGRAEVEFMDHLATLRLPALAYDFKLATVARNLLARECEAQGSKPLTRYFQMLNELVEDAADVRVLRRAGVVRGGSGAGAEEVLGLIKAIDGHATYPSVYMAMDREIEKVKRHHDERMKSFFVRNRPGVIWASSAAAISVVAIVAARMKRG